MNRSLPLIILVATGLSACQGEGPLSPSGVVELDVAAEVIPSPPTPPVVLDLLATPNPAAVGTAIVVTATITGTSTITGASIGPVGPADTAWTDMSLSFGGFDQNSASASDTLWGLEAGVHEFCVYGSTGDGSGTGTASDKLMGAYEGIPGGPGDPGGETIDGDRECVFVAVYDPSGGFVTGGGWIDSPAGAYPEDLAAEGKATFGFVSKYKKGASVPTGNTEFQFHATGMNFHSTSYDFLVITMGGTNAQFKGTGTINGEGNFKFMIWARDDSQDTFRIKIWSDEGGVETLKYDNGFDQALAKGSIVIHKK